MKPLTVLTGAMMLCALPAAAQTSSQPDQQEPPASPCQAEPGQNSNSGNGTGKAAGRKPSLGDLSQKLDPCNGVLKPPPTGDTGLTAPAPDQGNTPIIKPGQLPPQPPKK